MDVFLSDFLLRRLQTVYPASSHEWPLLFLSSPLPWASLESSTRPAPLRLAVRGRRLRLVYNMKKGWPIHTDVAFLRRPSRHGPTCNNTYIHLNLSDEIGFIYSLPLQYDFPDPGFPRYTSKLLIDLSSSTPIDEWKSFFVRDGFLSGEQLLYQMNPRLF